MVARAAEIVDQLTEQMTKLAFMKGSELRLRHETTERMTNQGSNITTARETASVAVSNYTVELIKIQAEIDTLHLALAHCDRALNNWTEL